MKKSGPKAKRGFALMSPERRREITARGGKAAHERGTAYRFTSEVARKAQKRKTALGRRSKRP